MGLSTGGGFRYGHVLLCTWFFSNWPYTANSWKAITFCELVAPCSSMEVTLSNFDTAFCGPVAHSVGPPSSSAHTLLRGGQCAKSFTYSSCLDYSAFYPVSRLDPIAGSVFDIYWHSNLAPLTHSCVGCGFACSDTISDLETAFSIARNVCRKPSCPIYNKLGGQTLDSSSYPGPPCPCLVCCSPYCETFISCVFQVPCDLNHYRGRHCSAFYTLFHNHLFDSLFGDDDDFSRASDDGFGLNGANTVSCCCCAQPRKSLTSTTLHRGALQRSFGFASAFSGQYMHVCRAFETDESVYRSIGIKDCSF